MNRLHYVILLLFTFLAASFIVYLILSQEKVENIAINNYKYASISLYSVKRPKNIVYLIISYGNISIAMSYNLNGNRFENETYLRDYIRDMILESIGGMNKEKNIEKILPLRVQFKTFEEPHGEIIYNLTKNIKIEEKSGYYVIVNLIYNKSFGGLLIKYNLKNISLRNIKRYTNYKIRKLKIYRTDIYLKDVPFEDLNEGYLGFSIEPKALCIIKENKGICWNAIDRYLIIKVNNSDINEDFKIESISFDYTPINMDIMNIIGNILIRKLMENRIKNIYFEEYEKVKQYYDKVIKRLKESGYKNVTITLPINGRYVIYRNSKKAVEYYWLDRKYIYYNNAFLYGVYSVDNKTSYVIVGNGCVKTNKKYEINNKFVGSFLLKKENDYYYFNPTEFTNECISTSDENIVQKICYKLLYSKTPIYETKIWLDNGQLSMVEYYQFSNLYKIIVSPVEEKEVLDKVNIILNKCKR